MADYEPASRLANYSHRCPRTDLAKMTRPTQKGMPMAPILVIEDDSVLSTFVCEQTTIVAAARRYAARYGVDAADYARCCAAAMLVAGNVDGWWIWSGVIRAIEEVQRQGAAHDELPNWPTAAGWRGR
jgi:hypothetical protein